MEKCLILNENLHQNVREILKIQMDIFHYDSIMILRIDEDGTCTPLLQSDDDKYKSFILKSLEDIKTNEVILKDKLTQKSNLYKLCTFFNVQALFPILLQDVCVAIMAINSPVPQFTSRQIEVAIFSSSYIENLISNENLVQDLEGYSGKMQKMLNEMITLHEITHALESSDNLDSLLEYIMQKSQKVMEAEAATQMITLYVKIEDLQKENLRVSESLFTSGKATHNVVFRARAELSHTEQEKLNMENLQKQSRSYFNFILNKPLDSNIEPLNPDTLPLPTIPDFESVKHEAFMNREELLQIKNVVAASDDNAAIARSRYFPGINAVVDYGIQGEEYRFTDQDDFWMASVVLEWNIFNGQQDKAKLEQAKLETRKMQIKEEELKRQIELEVERIYDNLIVARKTINVSRQQIESAEASFKIVRKKYEEGTAAQVEYLDAQTNLTNAAINAIITKYDFFVTYAEFEKIAARYLFEDNN